jgi:1-deoxy-D-xylulose-5-phosphate synthase
MQLGKGVVRRSGKDIAILGYGTIVNSCLKAADLLAESGISATVVDMRFCKPLDKDLVRRCAKEHGALLLVEENAIGGFASHGAPATLFSGNPFSPHNV